LFEFLRLHHDWLHGLELNGYRTWEENRRVLPLAEGFGLPLVGGGDRHGHAQNAIVNLTRATSLAEFADELREERSSHCVVLPEYERAFAWRVLRTASDVLRPHPRSDGRHWQDRVFLGGGGNDTPLATAWPHTPWWVHAAVGVVRALGSPAGRVLCEFVSTDGRRTLELDCTHETTLGDLHTARRSAAA
jgi:hypothetical protein